MSKMIREKNNIFNLYMKTLYITETYSLNTPLRLNETLIEEME